MKICAIICEYNPFHNGHLYQIAEAKRLSGADAVLCLMSGNFVQRGEAAVMDKFTRARHAILGGADIVLELPTVFATSNAELFAKGAISILSQIPAVKTLAFGAETADKAAFMLGARYLNHEPEEVSAKIKESLATGASYPKARTQAWAGFLPLDLLSSPNNILGLEYTRAILDRGADIEILPIQRVGSGYNDSYLQEQFSSASAIRLAIKEKRSVSGQLPDFAEKELPNALENKLDTLEKYALLCKPLKDIANVCDCTEGLENAFKRAAGECQTLEAALTSARYTSSRIRRIALQNLLDIEEAFIRDCLQSPLYLRVLAAKKGKNEVLSALSLSTLPVIARAHDENCLTGVAKECFEKDVFAEKTHGLLYCAPTKESLFV